MSTDEPEAKVFPRGLAAEEGYENFPKGPPTVVITHRGYHFILRFAPGDLAGAEGLRKLEIAPVEGETLEPRALRQFAPITEVYLAYAQAGMRLFGAGPLDEIDPEADWRHRHEDIREAAEALRRVAGPGRGLGDEFFRLIATEYKAFVDGGNPHPVKALKEAHHVTISAASRWVTEARRRGFLPKKEARHA